MATAPARAVTACLLAMLPGISSGLTYVLDPDDPSLPGEERIARIERRVARLETQATDMRRQGEAVNQLIAEGKLLESGLKDQVGVFRKGRASSTAQAAYGESGQQGLRWHCDRASALLPRISTLGGDVVRAQQRYVTTLAATPLASEGSEAKMAEAIVELRSGLQSAIDLARPESLQSDLKDVGQGLDFSWGAYTTLRQLAVQAETQSRELLNIAQRMQEVAAALDKPIENYQTERLDILSALGSLHQASFSAAQWHRASKSKEVAERTFVAPIRALTNNAYRDSATWWGGMWTTTAKQASNEVYAAIRPLHEAAQACGDADNPARQFAEGRQRAARNLAQATTAIDSAGHARAGAADAECKKLDAALVAWRGVLQDALTRSSHAWRQMEASPAGSVRQQDFRSQFDRLTLQKKKAEAAVQAIPPSLSACLAEAAALKKLLPTLNPSIQALRALFPKEA